MTRKYYHFAIRTEKRKTNNKVGYITGSIMNFLSIKDKIAYNKRKMKHLKS